MKSTVFVIFILFVAACVGTGCEHTPTSAEQPTPHAPFTNSFFPMHVGDYWIYSTIGNPEDSVERAEINSMTTVAGNKYFVLSKKYLGKINRWKPDTLYLRFLDSNILVRLMDGKEPSYIDFSLPMVTYQLGERYPGVVNEYPYLDSISIGKFDSLKHIIFRGPEPVWAEFSEAIGAIEWDIPFPMTLVSAKVDGKILP